MAAFDDAEPGAAQQDQDGGGDAGAARNVTLDQVDQPMLRLALERRPCGATQPQPLAQQDHRADGGGLQVSLGPRRSQRSSGASCTIQCTSSSKVARKALRVLAQ